MKPRQTYVFWNRCSPCLFALFLVLIVWSGLQLSKLMLHRRSDFLSVLSARVDFLWIEDYLCNISSTVTIILLLELLKCIWFWNTSYMSLFTDLSRKHGLPRRFQPHPTFHPWFCVIQFWIFTNVRCVLTCLRLFQEKIRVTQFHSKIQGECNKNTKFAYVQVRGQSFWMRESWRQC